MRGGSIKTSRTLSASRNRRAGRQNSRRGAALTHLIDNLLNSARLLESGAELYFHPAEMDLGALLREVCQLHREMAPGAQIVERFAPTPCPCPAIPSCCFRCSAIFCPTPSNIRRVAALIEVRPSPCRDVLSAIDDRGIGIPPHDLDRLFERYYRGSNVSGIVGTGVGLYLVKMVVDLHGGRVEVKRRGGEWLRFTIRLPLRPAPGTNVWPPARRASDRGRGRTADRRPGGERAVGLARRGARQELTSRRFLSARRSDIAGPGSFPLAERLR